MHGTSLSFLKKYNYLGIMHDTELNLNITFDIAIQIDKQTILLVFDYGGFLTMSLNKNKQDNWAITPEQCNCPRVKNVLLLKC